KDPVTRRYGRQLVVRLAVRFELGGKRGADSGDPFFLRRGSSGKALECVLDAGEQQAYGIDESAVQVKKDGDRTGTMLHSWCSCVRLCHMANVMDRDPRLGVSRTGVRKHYG